MKTLLLGLATAVLVSGCATGNIKPAYVSPTQYQTWNCAQLHSEYTRLNQYLANGVETPTRTGVGLGVGLGGWGGGWGIRPSVSVNVGQSSNTKRTEISQLYGQQDAIEQAANFKNCPITNPRPKTS